MTTASDPIVATTAGFIMNELDPGAQIRSFTASFQLVLGGGSATPAERLQL